MTRQTLSFQVDPQVDPSRVARSSSAFYDRTPLSFRERSVSFQPQEHNRKETPRLRKRISRHKRNVSGASHQSIHLSPPVQASRSLVRKSLTGSAVLGMTINDRAEILADVAGDCLVTLVKSAFEERPRSRRNAEQDEARKAWEGLYAIRQSYIFPPYSPPFPLPTDILESFHSQVRAAVDPSTLTRAVQLSNLATFIWSILRPDEAGSMLAALDMDDEDNKAGRVTRAKGKAKATDVDFELLKKVRRRNAILLSAWKRFWLIVVPRDKRTSESALRIWLDFATQIQLVYRCRWIGSHSQLDDSLPPPPPLQIRDLFSPSAVGRYGQWEISEDFDSQSIDEEKFNIEERWNTLAKRRAKELNSLATEVLMRKYPYIVFQQEMMAYIQHEILGSPNAALLTPGRRRLLIGSAAEVEESSSESDPSNGMDDDVSDPSEQNSRTGIEEDPSDDPIDHDLLAEIANELDQEQQSLKNRSAPQTHDGGENITDDLAYQQDEVEEETEWIVKDHQQARAAAQAVPSGRFFARPHADDNADQNLPPRFNWAARQADAMQVDWESQSVNGSEGSAEYQSHSNPQEDDVPSSPVVSGIEASHTGNIRASGRRSSPPPLHASRTSYLNVNKSTTPRPYRVVGRDSTIAMPPAAPDSPSGSSNEEEEFVEEEATPEMSGEEENIADLLPDMAQFTTRVAQTSSNGPQTPQQEDGEPRTADLLSDGNMLTGEGILVQPVSANGAGFDMDIPDDEPDLRDGDLAQTTSQAAFISSRPRKSLEAHQFALPDEEEDHEDRELLHQAQRARELDRLPAIKPEPMPRHDRIEDERPFRPLLLRGGRAQPSQLRDEDDPYLVDENGSPLEPDELYMVPLDHAPQKSQIHGKLGNTQSTYCRLTGPRRWAKEEELLLYRTVQKVPMEEEYPLRAAWFLHGEFGRFSTALKWFNTQHMKDKMRVIVSSRLNKGRPVVGRARFWLPKGNPGKLQYEEELEETKRRAEVREEEEARQPADAAARPQEGPAQLAQEDEDGESDVEGVDQEDEVEELIDDDDFPEAVTFDIDENHLASQRPRSTPKGRRNPRRKSKGRRSYAQMVEAEEVSTPAGPSGAQARAERYAKRQHREEQTGDGQQTGADEASSKRPRRRSEVVIEITPTRPTGEEQEEVVNDQEPTPQPSKRRRQKPTRYTKYARKTVGVTGQRARKTAQPTINRLPEPEVEEDSPVDDAHIEEEGEQANIAGSAVQATQYTDGEEGGGVEDGLSDDDVAQEREAIKRRVLGLA
nr:uncharacterized protein CI109_006111 [Kwoniella shandongensis]KAA5525538.1 hypothetical protein CI109_006111 [Kwoniella shandongensis]